MKKIYPRLLLILFVFVVAAVALQFLPPHPVLRIALNVLLLPTFMVLLVVFFWTTLLRPLQEIKRSLLHFRQTGRSNGFGPGPNAEFAEIFANLGGIYAAAQDKTREAREAKEFLEKLMQTAQAMVIKFDRGMHPVYLNTYGLKKFQAENKSIDALRISDFLDKKFIHEIIGALKQSDHIVDKETTMVLKTGERMDIALSFSVLRDPGKKVTGYLAVIADISMRKKAEI
ncbi:MAG TPA: PAS domain-containing protein, partial [Candidatus Binatia bacterium]|nr:PAS domain-containing protein [Candidatus Binatia bacterium]